MDDVERWSTLAAGVVGLLAFAGGSLLAVPPPVDATDDDAARHLAERRTPILLGSVLAVLGAGLLLWPLAAVTTAGDADRWSSLGPFSLVAWAVGFGLLALAVVAVAAVAWRDATALAPATLRLVLDAAHLATWSVSAPLGAVAVVATTTAGVQGKTLGPAVVVAAGVKVATVAVELAGTGRRRGWNAGGWAAGSSGYATVAWFALVLIGLG